MIEPNAPAFPASAPGYPGLTIRAEFASRNHAAMLAVVLGRISVDNVSEAVLDNITKVAIGEADRPHRRTEQGHAMTTEQDALEPLRAVRVLPTEVWVEDRDDGSRVVMLQHEGFPPFAYAVFNYSYAYTDNAGTRAMADELAVRLGASFPVEHRKAAMRALKEKA